jgi:UDP-N-acetylmuramate--alanine ligase
MPGRHNALNALAAIAIAGDLGIADSAVVQALATFEGVDRRLQVRGDIALAHGSVLHIDDYGHHPREIAAVLAAVRDGWPERRLVLAFQPHRYTRTHELLDDFADVLSQVDVLVLAEVYAAGEPPIDGADGRALAQAVTARGGVMPVFVDEADAIVPALGDLLRDGDLVLTMGAGDIGTVAAGMHAQLTGGAHG